MPISKSAKKALRVARKKTSVNRHRKALLKDALKNVNGESLSKAVSMVDKAAKWGIIHPNKAARVKSKISKIATASAPAAKKSEPKKATAKKTTTKKK